MLEISLRISAASALKQSFNTANAKARREPRNVENGIVGPKSKTNFFWNRTMPS